MKPYHVHPDARVEADQIGEGTRIWAFTHIMKGVEIGRDCNICDGSFLETGVVVGRGVTIKQHVDVCEGVILHDAVFVGPHAVFTNDLRPRSPRAPVVAARYAGKGWLRTTVIQTGATIGANATICCGVTMGPWSFAGAGAVVVRDVAPFTLVVGNPARPIGYLCACAESLWLQDGQAACRHCGREYRLHDGRLAPLKPIALWDENDT